MRKFIPGGILVFLFSFLVIFTPSEAYPQTDRELTTTSNRARRAFQDALQKFNYRDVDGAEESFREAIDHDPDFIEAHIVLGEMMQSIRRYEEAIEAFQNAVQINPDFFPNAFYYLGESYLAMGEYSRAYESLQQLSNRQVSDQIKQRAATLIEKCEFAIEAQKNPVPFEPINLGPNINTENEEYAPTLTADEQTLIFTRKKPRDDPSFFHLGYEYEDFYISFRDEDGQWGPAENLGPPINTQHNEGAQSISADGMHLYFTACNRPDGMGSCDIYYARRAGDRWSEPVNLGPPINTPAWESQPSISPDGRTLYFTSNRSGNHGKMDIWISTQVRPGQWSEPQNLGKVINTTGREMSPFIHPDNRTLFFSSDGHIGMGGMDLFYTVKDSLGDWEEPVNLGYPINTYDDEISLVVGASGKEAYFASGHQSDTSSTDLYFFELYEQARPTPVSYMKGFVFDANTRQRLEARFELVDLQSEEVIAESYSERRTGEFLIPIPVGANLALNVWRDGYLFFSENFAFDDARTQVDPHLYDVPLQPIQEGESVVLRNIFFKHDSHELLPESISELNRLVELLEQNPGLKIEISGHTDDTGSFDYNMNLSEKRALSVYNYLLEHDINKKRLSYKGYADQEPIATNETEEGRAKNRRTEFKVMGND